MNIYVGNLPYKIGEEELREIFEVYGEISSVKVIIDKFTKRSKGFGFVDMTSQEEATNAVNELNGAELFGRYLKVNEARERKTYPKRD